MIRKVLIANRGEIAVRIARACADYGVRSAAVYADPDADALHVRRSDEAWALRGTRAADTYLDIGKLLDAARRSGADAVHPGYGFLSERADFARAVTQAGLTWIGPPPDVIAALGDKVAARRIAQEAGAPLVAGTPGPIAHAGDAMAFARAHGLPIAIKATHGGGGRGLKVAWQLDDIEEQYDAAVREATAAFGRGDCYVEQFLDRPRHIEAQVLADTHGQVVVVGTRDCTLQRRNQKLVEEAPAPFLDDTQRHRIHDAARAICARAGYIGAGTVEFLLSQDGRLSFLEVNTRLQVEHPITEETTGLDLVVEQLRIADGLPLSIVDTPAPRGHSIEFRINAEDPARGFLPTPGRVTTYCAPEGPGVRVDSGVAAGASVPGQFDSLMAKLIVTGANREHALRRARRALAEFRIDGVASVLPFHRAVLNEPDFIATDGFRVHTRWIDTEFAARIAVAPRPEPLPDEPMVDTYIELDGKRVALRLPGALLANPAIAAPTAVATVATPDHPADADADTVKQVSAPFTGTLLSWQTSDGATVQADDPIAVMEAMKMETVVTAPVGGIVRHTAPTGQPINAGDVLATIEPDNA